LRARGTKRRRRDAIASAALSARIGSHVALEARLNGTIIACFDHHSVDLGQFSTDAAERAQDLRNGLPLNSTTSGASNIDKEIQLILKRLASHGLLEYRLTNSQSARDELIIEPQTPDYWPHAAQLDNSDILVLSRFAYLRRRGNAMVLESPRAGAAFQICNPTIAAILTGLATPQQLKQLRRRDGFPGIELFALLVDCQILVKIDPKRSSLRLTEGDGDLVLWDFHDLLFHTRSTAGRHANPLGGLYPYAGVLAPLPAVRPHWPGKKINLTKSHTTYSELAAPTAKLLRERHSFRTFDDGQPITLAELAGFLASTARVQLRWESRLDLGDCSPVVEYTARPYPSGGGCYELELYLAVDKCEGLTRGFYHYDAGGHVLTPINVRSHEFEALLAGAALAMDAQAAPPILITITARFGRVSWKYSSLAYSLILKDVGALLQTFYLMATDMGLGGCAIGTTNIDLFAKMTGIEFHVEGPVGQFAMGGGAKQPPLESQ
jgi:SagB-type dehydrogenase family enzyme